jgi:hypothetical protein
VYRLGRRCAADFIALLDQVQSKRSRSASAPFKTWRLGGHLRGRLAYRNPLGHQDLPLKTF